MKTWYTIKAQATADAPAEISIYDSIGMWGVSAKDFIGELKETGAKAITLSINSPGGSVFDAIAIYNALRASGAKITVRILGLAASAASYIAMAGDKIIMPKNTFMMIHNPLIDMYGNAEELRDTANFLDKIGASLTATYAKRTGLSVEDVSALLAAETWLTADEAVRQGFADAVEDELKISAAFDVDRLPENIQAAFRAASKPTEKPPVVTAKTFAAEVNALATEAGLKDHVAAWLVDASLTTIEQAKAAIAEAAEVKALCEFANQPDLAPKMIEARTALPDARAALCKLRADASDQTAIDSVQPSGVKPQKNTPPAAGTTASIWASRHKQIH